MEPINKITRKTRLKNKCIKTFELLNTVNKTVKNVKRFLVEFTNTGPIFTN